MDFNTGTSLKRSLRSVFEAPSVSGSAPQVALHPPTQEHEPEQHQEDHDLLAELQGRPSEHHVEGTQRHQCEYKGQGHHSEPVEPPGPGRLQLARNDSGSVFNVSDQPRHVDLAAS